MKDALRAIRADLGPDALVLSSARVRTRGVRGWLGAREVEVTAAVDRIPLSDFRPADDVPDDTAATREVAARLEAAGMAVDLARLVAGALPPGQRRVPSGKALRRALRERLLPLASGDEAYAPIEVFVGPPGAGKTTTIAKIAAQERARHGQRLGLLAADGFRVGAVEQLRMFADIIGAPFAVARSPEELHAALAAARRPLLLDTAGRSPNDEASREMFRVLAGRADVRVHLVLPAATSPLLARRAFERFADAHPRRLVLTKLDESDSIAPLFGVMGEAGLPLSYLGTGQSVPHDLQRATPDVLVDWVLGERAAIGAVA